jgi:hypothetical protein
LSGVPFELLEFGFKKWWQQLVDLQKPGPGELEAAFHFFGKAFGAKVFHLSLELYQRILSMAGNKISGLP